MTDFNDTMALSLPSKLFWSDKIVLDPESDVLLDFGAGRGDLVTTYNELRRKDGLAPIPWIAHDTCYDTKFDGFWPDTRDLLDCTQDEANLRVLLGQQYGDRRIVAIFSSVLHELDTAAMELARVVCDRAACVVIRDWMVGDESVMDVADGGLLYRVRSLSMREPDFFAAYVAHHGMPYSPLDCAHLALHYLWRETAGEMAQDYFGARRDDTLGLLGLDAKRAIHDELEPPHPTLVERAGTVLAGVELPPKTTLVIENA